MLGYLIDQIPLWVYVTVTLLGVGAAFYFFSPILVPLWNVTPRWVKVVGGVVLAVLAAFVSGRNRGNRNAKEEQKRREAQAVHTREVIHEDVQKLDPVDTDKRLDRWLRDK